MKKNLVVSLLYNTIFTGLLPLAFVRLGIKGLRAKNYFKRWPERLGHPKLPPLRDVTWIHAVSVGEVQAATPLINHFLQSREKPEILVTCTTPTGSKQIQKTFSNQVRHCYLPFDSSLCLGPFLAKIKPKQVLIMETEIWPNLFHHCQQQGIPLFMINARLSLGSFQGYKKIRPFIKRTLQGCTKILCQSAEDRERFVELGAPRGKVHNCGNLKFDYSTPLEQVTVGTALRTAIGKSRPVWIGASTHPGEEEKLLKAHQQIIKTHPQALLILVPRHPERFEEVFSLCQRQGMTTVRRSQRQAVTRQVQVYLGDTMGELAGLYAAADLAFVGGSLVPVGGHNLLEPASLGRAVLSGPNLDNFKEISKILLSSRSLLIVETWQELAKKINQLLAAPARLQELGEKAKQAVAVHRGALDKILEHLRLP